MSDKPSVDWTPASGIDSFAVRWKATTAMVISDRAAPSGRVLDWVRYNVEVERDEYAPDPAVVVATAPSMDLAAYIAILHNSLLDTGGRAPLSAALHRAGNRLAAALRRQLAVAIRRTRRPQ